MASPSSPQPKTIRAAIATSLGTALLFEVCTVPETQIKSNWAASPWRQDPYHTAVLMAQFAALVLGLLIGLRLLARHAPGEADRSRQLLRAATVVVAFVGLAVAFEWGAVAANAWSTTWTSDVVLQVAGLVAVSAMTIASAALLVGSRDPATSSGRWQHDWLGDVVYLCRRVPVLRGVVTPHVATWIRRHTYTVFVSVSVLVAALLTAAQSAAEDTTDPLFIAWMLVSLTACVLAFCAVSNSVAGFIARPPRTRSRRDIETAVMAGCVATLVAIAFHDPLWSAIGSGHLTPSALATLTLGAGAVTFAASVMLLHHRTARGADERRRTASV